MKPIKLSTSKKNILPAIFIGCLFIAKDIYLYHSQPIVVICDGIFLVVIFTAFFLFLRKAVWLHADKFVVRSWNGKIKEYSYDDIIRVEVAPYRTINAIAFYSKNNKLAAVRQNSENFVQAIAFILNNGLPLDYESDKEIQNWIVLEKIDLSIV